MHKGAIVISMLRKGRNCLIASAQRHDLFGTLVIKQTNNTRISQPLRHAEPLYCVPTIYGTINGLSVLRSVPTGARQQRGLGDTTCKSTALRQRVQLPTAMTTQQVPMQRNNRQCTTHFCAVTTTNVSVTPPNATPLTTVGSKHRLSLATNTGVITPC